MFFNDWNGLLAVLVAGACCYPALVIFLRVSGKRTLSKLNAFDLVVTVALGSTMATVIVSRDVPIFEGLLALVLLIGLQLAVAWTSLRSRAFRRLVKAEPRLLYAEDGPVEKAMKEERITLDELISAARANGKPSLESVRFIILETNGELSVIPKSASGALRGLRPA